MRNSITNLISRNQLDQPGYSISEIESSEAEAKVERNGMISGEQNRCLGFRGA